MRKLIIIYYPVENYSLHGLIRGFIKIFNTEEYKNILLEKYNFEVITADDIVNKLNKTEGQYIDDINNDKIDIKDAIFFGIHPYGIHTIDKISTKTRKNKNIKTIGWTDDVHYFANPIKDRKDKSIPVQKYIEAYDSLLIENLDYLLTPSSIYFKNLNITKYNDKIIDMFYFLTPDYYRKNFLNYPDRKDEIILSGAIGGGYISRILFQELKNSSKEFTDLIYVLPHPGRKNNTHMTGLNYYKKLSEFKGAFAGHYNFPINFLLGKHIEILMCGCLGFFEPSPLLQSQLGLQEYVHYIPCYKNGRMIDDINFYKDWLKNGDSIAKQGREYIIENFGEKQMHKLFAFLQNC